jgi:hypothetical protein
MNIRKQPYNIDFIGNRPEYVLLPSSQEEARASVWFSVETDGETATTPQFHLFGNGNGINVPVSMLKAYFKGRDIPAAGETAAAIPCGKSLMHAVLHYSPSGSVREKTSGEVLLVNGAIDQYAADNNMPDWAALTQEKFWRKAFSDIFGQDNADTVISDTETEQYLYVANFTPDAENSCNLMVEENRSGSVREYTAATVNIPAQTIVRIPCGVEALGIAEADTLTAYTVKLYAPYCISRTFMMHPRPWSAQTALLVNRTGMLETFVFNNIAEAASSEGEEALTGRNRRYLHSSHGSVFTARTGLRTEKELAILRSALHEEGNMLIDGEYAWHISFEPSSAVIVDREEDLLEVEVNFLKGEKTSRKKTQLDSIGSDSRIERTDYIIK